MQMYKPPRKRAAAAHSQASPALPGRRAFFLREPNRAVSEASPLVYNSQVEGSGVGAPPGVCWVNKSNPEEVKFSAKTNPAGKPVTSTVTPRLLSDSAEI